MKKPLVSHCFTLLACVATILLTGCASEKPKPLAQRGWIGGEYTLAKPWSHWVTLSAASGGIVGGLPKPIQSAQKGAILITKLETNTPAQLAGLRKGDYILELNHQPMTSLQGFRRTIDRSQPGTSLAVKAWRDGQTAEYKLPIGQEKYKKGGTLSFTLPTVVHRWDLWPNPGFSLVFLGYEPNPGLRHDLGASHEVYDEDWSAYLVIMEVSMGKRVQSQDTTVASAAPAQKQPVQFAMSAAKNGN